MKEKKRIVMNNVTKIKSKHNWKPRGYIMNFSAILNVVGLVFSMSSFFSFSWLVVLLLSP